jgi:hypothetical protein
MRTTPNQIRRATPAVSQGWHSLVTALFMTRLFGLFPGESPNPLLGMWPKGMVLDCGPILVPPQRHAE